MNENLFKSQTKRKLRGRAKLQSIESHLTNQGIADESFSLPSKERGWIEFKWKREWPKRSSTPLRLEHFTPKQRSWLTNEGRWAGRCFVALRVADDIMLFHWRAIPLIGELPRDELIRAAVGYWPAAKFDAEEFTSILKHDRDYK